MTGITHAIAKVLSARSGMLRRSACSAKRPELLAGRIGSIDGLRAAENDGGRTFHWAPPLARLKSVTGGVVLARDHVRLARSKIGSEAGMQFQTTTLPEEPDVVAPDGSDVRVLLRLDRGMWRKHGEHANTVDIEPGVCLTIPVGTHSNSAMSEMSS